MSRRAMTLPGAGVLAVRCAARPPTSGPALVAGRSRRVLLLASALLAGLLDPGIAQARDGFITSFDGTKVAYSFWPAHGLKAGEQAPTALNGPGYASGRGSESNYGRPLNHGYNVLAWDPRGFGQSTGQVEFDSPDFEGRDVQALIDVIAQQPEAQLDAPGDPRLGMTGGSYGGTIQSVVAASDPRVDAITPQISWRSLVTSLYKHETPKVGWGSLLYGEGTEGAAVGTGPGPAGLNFGRIQDPVAALAIANGAATGSFTADERAFFAARGPGDLVDRITVPTLILQGTDDTLFTLQEGIENYEHERANGVPTKMIWFCGSLTSASIAHGICNTPEGPQPNIVAEASLRWLDRYVKGDQSADTGPTFRWVSDTGTLHYARTYPVAAGEPVTGTGSGTLAVLPGDTSGELIVASRAANALNIPLRTPPAETSLVGTPTLTLAYDGTAARSDGRLYAQLINERTGLVLGNQTTPVPVELDGAPHTLSIPLEAVASDALAGTSYTLQLTGGSSLYSGARQPALVHVTNATVLVPTAAPGASSTDPAQMADAAPAAVTVRCTPAAVRVTLHARPGTRLVRAAVYVDGILRKTVHGHRLTRLKLPGLGDGSHTVRVDTFTPRGLAVRSIRTLDRCGTSRNLRHRRPGSS